jgi:peptide/nickel transport system permease protein
VLGLVMVSAISNAVFAEQVFVLPGLGSLTVTATSQHNLPVLQAAALWFTLLTIAINLVVDISYGWLNPKVRVR